MHGVNAGPLHCVIAPLFVTLAAVLLSVIVLLVVGLPCCVVPARGAQGGKPGVEHSLTLLVSPCLWLRLGVLPLFWIWGGMRGCSYLASYDELLYICVHTPSISPTPTVGGTLILADGFHLRLCILLSISNVIYLILTYEPALLTRLIYFGNVAAAAQLHFLCCIFSNVILPLAPFDLSARRSHLDFPPNCTMDVRVADRVRP